MLATRLIAVGVTTGTVVILEVLVSEAQKMQLSNQVVRAWNWLADLKTRSIVNWSRHRGVRAALIFLETTNVLPVLASRFLP